MPTVSEPIRCLSCGCELHPREVREILADGLSHGPFCARCAASAEVTRFARSLAEQWRREPPH
jgi:hypothetical protein